MYVSVYIIESFINGCQIEYSEQICSFRAQYIWNINYKILAMNEKF
jgi:hypothetical protein